jgi:hypothetical protein
MFFQALSSNVMNALTGMAIAKENILALKKSAGKSEPKMHNAYESETAYKSVRLCETDLDEQRFLSLKGQLCHAVAENLYQRFPYSELLNLS